MPKDEIAIESPPFWERVRRWEPSNALLWLALSVPLVLGGSYVDESPAKFVVMRVIACVAVIPACKLIRRGMEWME